MNQKRIIIILIIGVVLLLILSSLLLWQPALVMENSMEPALSNGDWIFIQKVSKNPEKGDIVIFKNPFSGDFVIKRVILVEHEKLVIDDNWLITDFGSYYLSPRQIETFLPTNYVPENFFFAAGDNMMISEDSRDWGFISYKDITGKMMFNNSGEITE
jgi:signal peptidase I